MWLNSIHGINDASGHQESICEGLKPNTFYPNETLEAKFGDSKDINLTLASYNEYHSWTANSSYSVFTFNISSVAVWIRFGICLPSVCSQQHLNEFGDNVSDELTLGV